MKKLLSTGLLTVCALAVTARPADAWVNSKFSIGLNWHVQSANNNVLWGAWKNGQVPGPEAFGQPGAPPPGFYGPGPGQPGPMPGPGPYMPPVGSFPFFGNNPQAFPAETAPPAAFQGMNANYPMQQQYSYNPYQTVGYQPPYQNYYLPNYYQNYGYQMPYYWYQGR